MPNTPRPQPRPLPPLAIDIADLIDLLAGEARRSESKARTKAQLVRALDRYVDDRVRLALEQLCLRK